MSSKWQRMPDITGQLALGSSGFDQEVMSPCSTPYTGLCLLIWSSTVLMEGLGADVIPKRINSLVKDSEIF